MIKRGDFNFVWLFAIVAGTAVLILAILGAVKYGKTTSHLQDTEIAKTLAVVTDSMQAGFSSGKKSVIGFSKPTIIENSCYEEGFGFNELSVMTKERPSQTFESFGTPIRVLNKYLYIPGSPGTEFYVFSVPLTFAFRVTDAIILVPNEYCFIGLDDEPRISSILSVLGSKAKFGSINCTEDSIKVCFDGLAGCDITVHPLCNNPDCESKYDFGIVEKEDYSVEYMGNLMYPAIFSEKSAYRCNLKRILYKQSILSNLYSQKVSLMNYRDCNVDLLLDLESFEQESFDLSRQSGDVFLEDIYLNAIYIKSKENRGQCTLWS